MQKQLTQGPVMPTMLRFAVPMVLGDLLQQCYNIADTLIVGRFIGTNALAAVGSAFTLMTFLTSILLGLAMGSGTVFSIRFGQKDESGLREGILAAFVLLAAVTAVLTGAVYLGFEGILWFLRLPAEIAPLMRTYLKFSDFAGLAAVFLYNYFASLLRALGNSVVPLLFLALSAGLNIALDLWFVCGLGRGVGGAAEATVIAQYVSGVGIAVYTWVQFPLLRESARCRLKTSRMKEIAGFSALTCIQQSIMNLGILAVQGLVNSFGTVVMAAFAAAVKIDAFAYLPVQDFGNAFSIFIAQNYGAQAAGAASGRASAAPRLRPSVSFGHAQSVRWCFCFAAPLMRTHSSARESAAVIAEGVRYLHIEGAFYCRHRQRSFCSTASTAPLADDPACPSCLTVVSLGTRVALGLRCWPLMPGHRRRRHLVVRADRLVFGRRRGRRVLLGEEKDVVCDEIKGCTKQKPPLCKGRCPAGAEGL